MAFPDSVLSRRLQTALPLWQAPMPFGIVPAAFSASVSASGALGMIRVGENSQCTELQAELDSCRQAGAMPAVCFMHRLPAHAQSQAAGSEHLRQLAGQYGISYPLPAADHFLDLLDIVIAAAPPAVGFAGGIPDKDTIRFIKEQGVLTFAIVSNVPEAITAEDFGIDCLVLQGTEAGGEQCGFDNQLPEHRQAAFSLLQQVRTLTPLPLVLWGDFTQGADIVAALLAGAQAVMLDRAFVQCALDDSRTAQANEYEVRLDSQYSLRPMRYLPAAGAKTLYFPDVLPAAREALVSAYLKQYPDEKPRPAAASANSLPCELRAMLAALQEQAAALIG